MGRKRKGFAKASLYKGFPEKLEIKEYVEQAFFVNNSVGSVSNRARYIEHNSSFSHYAAKSPPLLITDLKRERREVPTTLESDLIQLCIKKGRSLIWRKTTGE